jgi:hypothetical protein
VRLYDATGLSAVASATPGELVVFNRVCQMWWQRDNNRTTLKSAVIRRTRSRSFLRELPELHHSVEQIHQGAA